MALGVMLLILASPLLAPQLLAFPHKTQTLVGTVWSDAPLNPQMLEQEVAHARVRISTSPLASGKERRSIFVTQGGWRWHYLANLSSGAFAITRPFSDAIIINRTDTATGIIRNGQTLGGERGLGGVLAHEITHGLIRERYGLLEERRFPTWKVEGYCDYVAGESTLSAAQVADLEKRGENHPALIYYEGHKKVAAILRDNSGSVDALFQGNQTD